MPISVSITEDDNANIYSLTVSETGNSERFYIAKRLSISPQFKGVTEALLANVSSLSITINNSAETMNLYGQQQSAQQTFVSALGRAFQASTTAGIEALKEVEAVRSYMLSRRKIDPARAVAVADRIASMKAGEAAKLALRDPDIAASVLANWNLTGLPDALRPAIEESLLLANWMDEDSNRTRNERKPSLNEPFAFGLDYDAALADARQAIAVNEQKKEQAELLQSSLQSLVKFVALATELSPLVVFDKLSNGGRR